MDRTAIQDVIYQTCLLLDEKNFDAFLDLCDDEFRYTITTYSTEIRKDMIWLDHDKKGMRNLFDQLPRHNSDHSPITRHATVYKVEVDEGRREASAVSVLQVYKTDLDGGATTLFAVGKYVDTIKLDSGKPRLVKRVVKLDTRMLGIGYHIPF
ncbi:MAG: nuclear transport factor 2 family protein [Burkholderiales bacterium]|jgi:methanesulfonate monooxygenase small subunit|nr:nuclear transport factor 2 family protein [Burkholderiales bacterium]